MTIIGALRAAKAGEKVRKTAPFYSAVDEALANLKRNKGTGAEFFSELKNTKNIKPVELADRKLEEAFKAKGKMTKEEAQQVLADNPPPKVQERILEDIDGDERRRLLDDKMEIYGYDNYREVPHRVLREWNAEIDAEAAKYADDDYRTQGGSNYREMLLKLPQSYTEKDFHRLLMLEAEQRRGDLTPEQLKEITELQAKKQTAASNYQSGHWDDANVLAHMRVQDRLIAQPPQKGFYVVNKTSGRQSAMFDTPEELQAYVETLPESIRNNVTMAQGERKVPPRKVLQVEEIQSDWHQAGRKKGYASQENPMRMTGEAIPLGDNTYGVKWQDGSVDTLGYGKHHAETIAQEGKLTGVVPDAPFKKNWHELAMKRLLNYAAEKGYDGIAITPGAEHFKRYGSERIDWKKGDDGWIVGAKEQTGGRHEGRDLEEIARDRGILLERSGDQVKSKEDLHRIVNTVLNRENNPDQVNKLTNRIWDRMQTEAEGTSLPRKEGMEGFYDKMLTDYLNSYGRDYGAQVQMRQVAATPEAMEKKFNLNPNNLPDMNAEQASDYGKILQGFGNTQLSDVHYFPITQPMRESIKQKGLPLYQQVGIPTAGAGAASQMLEPQEEPQYGTGGAIAKMALKAAPPPRSPAIMRSSALTNVKSAVRQDKGEYGARRLDRAADEIPNLEKMFKQDALIEAFTGDNAKALMTMNPADFEKYAVQLKSRNKRPTNPSLEDRIRSGEIDKHDLPTDEYIKFLRTLPYGFDDVPFLQIDKQEYGLPLVPSISGHEGRHRSRALAESGQNKSLVRLFPDPELREPLPRRSQEEYIEALKKELEMTGKIVIPEDYGSDKRPPIILPDIYAKGGAVKPKVKDSKSGKVRMTTNRDTMFMELSNKKLKRK
tara:strand:+ start:368 stop:3025 length:2658 start_codon:yes stop_codon:yes gene_type:complete